MHKEDRGYVIASAAVGLTLVYVVGKILVGDTESEQRDRDLIDLISLAQKNDSPKAYRKAAEMALRMGKTSTSNELVTQAHAA